MAIVDVVKYNGTPDVFAWKYPSEELGTWTQLIVNESQEAILVKGGQALDIFGAGRHTLETLNIPLLRKVINLPFGGRSPFTAEIWYINKAYNLDIKWGTPTPVQIKDPQYGIFAPVRSNGAFGIHIADARKFLIKLVATMPTFDSTSITEYFRGLYVTKVKDSISNYLVHKRISILEINAYLDELSQYMKERIQPVIEEYGLELVSFYVNEISVPEEDSAIKQLKAALSKRAEMDILGYSYQQERSFDTLEGAAKNTGSTAAPLIGAGMGMGIGFGAGPKMGAEFHTIAQRLQTNGSAEAAKECPHCHARLPQAQRFCGNCGWDTEKAPKSGLSADDQSEPAETPQTVQPTCSACGCTISAEANFCHGCGRKLRHCPQCGNDMPDDAAKCDTCGYARPKLCPNCGTSVPETANFCPACGQSMVKRCPKCNAAVNDTENFCSICGEKL